MHSLIFNLEFNSNLDLKTFLTIKTQSSQFSRVDDRCIQYSLEFSNPIIGIWDYNLSKKFEREIERSHYNIPLFVRHFEN